MSLDLQQRYNAAINAVSEGDMNLLSRILTDPSTVTIDEQRSAAQQLGIKGGFLAAAVNTFSDPVVWASFLLSKRFPTRSWLQGTIPKRFVGAANEFSGISFVTRPVENFFRGTNVPKLVALKMRREAEVFKLGNDVFRLMDRPRWTQEMPLVSMLLEGQNPAGATPELRNVAKGIRAEMDNLWGLLRKTRHVTGGLEGPILTRARVSDLPPNMSPKYLRDFLPHIPSTASIADESVITMSGKDAIAKLMRGNAGQVQKGMGNTASTVWSAGESDRLSSDFIRYQGFLNEVGPHVFNRHLFKRQRFNIPLQSQLGQDVFVTDLHQVMQRYVHAVARTYSLNAPLTQFERTLASSKGVLRPSADPIMAQIINQGIDSMGPRLRRTQIPGTQVFVDAIDPSSINAPTFRELQSLVRSVKGAQSEDEIMFGNLFSSIRHKMQTALGRTLNKGDMTRLDDAVATFDRNGSYRQKVNGITSFFYSTTLGLNPWSAIQNLLQPIITTAPAIGIGSTIAGAKQLAGRVPRYAAEFKRQHRMLQTGKVRDKMGVVNEAAERAFAASFPELAKQGIRLDPRLFDIDESLTTKLLGRSRFRSADHFYKFLLQPFTQTELSNQAVSFFGAKHALRKAIRTGEFQVPTGIRGAKQLDDLLDFEASQVVNATQFRPGPGSRTVLQSMLPPPLRMFTSFPVRMASFLGESTVRGALTERQLETAGTLERLFGGRNWGTLARWLLFSKIATNGAREALGVDLGEALVPFNIETVGKTIVPLPFSPIATTTFGIAKAVFSGDIEELQPLNIPGLGDVPIPKTMVPGGVAITRASRAFQQFRPDRGGFVDDDERLMFRAGQDELILSMLGIPLEKRRREREAVERVRENRSRMTGLRRSYDTASINLDFKRMATLQGQYAEAFPGLGPLNIAPEDLDRYRANARMTRFQRAARTLGRNEPLLTGSIYEFDPDLIAPGVVP